MSRTIFIPWEKATKAFGVDADGDQFDRSDYAYDNAQTFCREAEIDDPDVCDEIRFKIEENIGASVFEKELDTIGDYIEQAIGHVKKGAVTSVQTVNKGRKQGIRVTITPAFVSAAAEIFGGTGLAGDTYSSALRNVKPDTVLNAASLVADVYGLMSFDQFHDSAFDRWEPDTGSYQSIRKYADKLSKKRGRR